MAGLDIKVRQVFQQAYVPKRSVVYIRASIQLEMLQVAKSFQMGDPVTRKSFAEA